MADVLISEFMDKGVAEGLISIRSSNRAEIFPDVP